MKIKYYPYQPHCFAFGGFDLQMLNTLKSINKLGVDVSKLDVWSRDNEFDIIHLWGIGQHNYHLINWAKKANKIIIATVLLPYFETIKSKLSFVKNYYSKYYKDLKFFYSQIDKVVVVNEIQREILEKYFNILTQKIQVIPNIVEDSFFKKPVFNFSNEFKISNFILCTGNICKRKNQYNLARACIELDKNLVLIGNVLHGEEDYALKLKKLVEDNNNIFWLSELPNGSEELVSAYYSCSIFALPSIEETQPISLLEATAAKKPIITLDKAYSKQKYFSHAFRSTSEKANDIAKAIFYADTTPYFNQFIEECRSKNVAMKYLELYKTSLNV